MISVLITILSATVKYTKMSVIKPKFAAAYEYVTESNDPSLVQVTIPLPEGVKFSDLSVQFGKKRSTVKVSIPNEIPILAGKCYGAVQTFKYREKNGSVILELTKDPSEEWPLLIQSTIKDKQRPGPDSIDPQSAMTLAYLFFQQGLDPIGLEYLKYSAQAMYPPAVILMTKTSVQMGQSVDSTMPLLISLVNDYNNARAAATIGFCGITGSISIETSIIYMRKGVELGDEECTMMLGILLSPVEEPHGSYEDIEESWKLLKKVEHLPRVKYTMAMLYAKGIGCEKDIELARKLMKEAVEVIPDLPEFEIVDEIAKEEPVAEEVTETVEVLKEEEKEKKKGGKLSVILASSTAVAVGIAAAVTLFRRFKKK